MQNNKWNIALGLLKADGLRPSPEFLDLTEKEKRGELTTDDIRQILNQKYGVKNNVLKGTEKMMLENRKEQE